MKSFTLTPTNSFYAVYSHTLYLSMEVTGATFAQAQLVIEERNDRGAWSRVNDTPVIVSDLAWFTFTASDLGKRVRFRAVGSGSYSIPINVKTEPVLSSDYLDSTDAQGIPGPAGPT